MTTSSFILAPSILSADLARLGEEAEQALAAGADCIHVDVMDNHYVPNLTFGPLIVKALRRHGIRAPIDVHLMVKPVDRLIPEFAEAGADYISIHPEATEHVDRTVRLITDHGCKAGMALNPATPLQHLDYVLDQLELVLIMSVNPGFGGQKFLPGMLEKLRQGRKLIDARRPGVRLEVDGGINTANIRAVAEAGADAFVAGSAIFGSDDYRATITAMRAELAQVHAG